MPASQDKLISLVLLSGDWHDLGFVMETYEKKHLSLNTRAQVATSQADRICLITVDGELVALALATSDGRSGDLDHRLTLRELRVLSEPVRWQQVLDALPANKKRHASAAISSTSIVPKGTGVAILEALISGGEARRLLEELRALRRNFSISRAPAEGQLQEEQRDSIALALEIAGFDSTSVLQDAGIPVGGTSFLDGFYDRVIEGGASSEAGMIRHDAQSFDDWVPELARIQDAIEFTDPLDPNRRLVVIYADKEDLEVVTGTDLIYYRVHQPGWVLVQYKRMKHKRMKQKHSAPTSKQWIYRADKQLKREIARMKKVQISEPGPLTDDWRLSPEPFWMKFVSDNKARPLNRRLLPGMYLPLSYFELLLTDTRTAGPRGGRVVGWHNVGRRFDNTQFAALLRDGWIGSSGATSDQIAALVEAALTGDRTVTVALDYAAASGPNAAD